jgi:hypothetical protein
MPMHDWTRVDPNDYHDFHGAWIYALRTALNNGLLPAGYFALAEHTTPPIIPDVVTLSLPDDPPPPFSHTIDANGDGGVAVATAPTTIVATAPGKKIKPAGRRRVAIHHARSRVIVAVIEIVSPSNKKNKPEFADLIGKTVQLLRQGAHVMLIDPFPPSNRDPNGINAVVWKELTGKSPAPAGKPLTLASYVALGGNTFTSYVEPLSVGDRLPDMRLYLSSEYFVKTPLEETYQVAWQGFPAPLRKLVEEQPVSVVTQSAP